MYFVDELKINQEKFRKGSSFSSRYRITKVKVGCAQAVRLQPTQESDF